ncbi:MAG: hypothetical protein M9900_04490 [Flavobacteriales bacterium]|nr:hypothetical protein [Flavobacteriales bacterium]
MDDIKGDHPWPHAYFIVVSEEHIKYLLPLRQTTWSDFSFALSDHLFVHTAHTTIDIQIVL